MESKLLRAAADANSVIERIEGRMKGGIELSLAELNEGARRRSDSAVGAERQGRERGLSLALDSASSCGRSSGGFSNRASSWSGSWRSRARLSTSSSRALAGA